MMIPIKYFSKKDPDRQSAPYWQVGYNDHGNKFKFSAVSFTHYSKSEADLVVMLLNDAVKRYNEINQIPEGDSAKLLGVNIIDPNDNAESQHALDILSSWLSITERLHEVMKGSLIGKVADIQNMILNLLEAAGNIDLKKDSQGNWKVYKKKAV